MTTFKPFLCVRPAQEKAALIAALPYDVYNRKEAKAVVEKNPLSFLKIDRAETQFPDDTDMYSAEVYERARDTLGEMIGDGSFIREEEPSYYVYALTYKGQTQTGVVGCASIDDYLNQIIRKHENTKEDKEQDRINHVDTMSAQTGPIFLAHRPIKELRELTDKITTSPPLYDIEAEDGVRHQVWRVDSDLNTQIEEIFAGTDHVYIADGHHRAASAVKVGLKRREAHPDYTGDEEFNYFLSVLFPSDELRIYDYNRVVNDLNGHTLEELLEQIACHFDIEEISVTDGQHTDFIANSGSDSSILVSTDSIYPHHKGEISMYAAGKWYRLTAHEDLYTQDPVEDLDVSILQNTVLEPLLGIQDPRTDSRIQFIGGIRGLKELVHLVDSGAGAIAFAMYPTSMDELLSVADEGLLMPPKSTWFEPKLRSGLFIHTFEK